MQIMRSCGSTVVIIVKLLINGLCWEKFNEKCNFSKKLTFLENSFNLESSPQ